MKLHFRSLSVIKQSLLIVDFAMYNVVAFLSIFAGVIVYQMGRLCGGAHEISGIKAPIFLHRWVGGGEMGGGGVGGGW